MYNKLATAHQVHMYICNLSTFIPLCSRKKTFKNFYSGIINGHDTIGMIVIDNKGNIAAGTTTNGASHKIPGYVVGTVLTYTCLFYVYSRIDTNFTY